METRTQPPPGPAGGASVQTPLRGMSPPGEASAPPSRPRRQAAMPLLNALGPGAARLFFYPSLLYTLFRERFPFSARPWFHRIDSAVLLGALPLRGRCRQQLIENENVRGVITMNEEYETRFLCYSSQEWEAMGVEQLRLSTVDLTGIPSLENLQQGVKFVLKHRDLGNSVYVHCKAGRCRSATMVAAYLIQLHQWTPQDAVEAIAKIRPHIIIRQKQLQLLEDFHRSITVETQQRPVETQLTEKKLPNHIRDHTLKAPGS